MIQQMQERNLLKFSAPIISSKEPTCSAAGASGSIHVGRTLKKEMTILSSILAWKIPLTVQGVCKRVLHHLKTQQQQ